MSGSPLWRSRMVNERPCRTGVTVSKQRPKERAGRLEAMDMRAAEHAVRAQLGLASPYQPMGPSS
jgi:hypothetical protein